MARDDRRQGHIPETRRLQTQCLHTEVVLKLASQSDGVSVVGLTLQCPHSAKQDRARIFIVETFNCAALSLTLQKLSQGIQTKCSQETGRGGQVAPSKPGSRGVDS